MTTALESCLSYVNSNGGIQLSENYPYTGEKAHCHASKNSSLASLVSGVTYITDNSATDILAAISGGPVVAAVSSSASDFMYYSSGILNSKACVGTLDLLVTIVGFGTENDVDFYYVRNSWGTDWGEGGYARIARS